MRLISKCPYIQLYIISSDISMITSTGGLYERVYARLYEYCKSCKELNS